MKLDYGMLLALSVVVIVELWAAGWEKSSLRRIVAAKSESTRRDIVLYALSLVQVTQVFTLTFSLGLVYFTAKIAREIVTYTAHVDLRARTGSAVGDLILFVLWFSFVDYWDHRLLHSQALWRLHRMHHTATEFNLITVLRNHPAMFAFEPLMRVWVAALLDTPAAFVLWWTIVVHAHTLLLHTNLDWRWGWLGKWILVSPAAHRVHHSVDAAHYGKNFATVLIIWDRVFGTWREPAKEPVEIGLIEEPSNKHRNLWRELVSDVVKMGR